MNRAYPGSPTSPPVVAAGDLRKVEDSAEWCPTEAENMAMMIGVGGSDEGPRRRRIDIDEDGRT